MIGPGSPSSQEKSSAGPNLTQQLPCFDDHAMQYEFTTEIEGNSPVVIDILVATVLLQSFCFNCLSLHNGIIKNNVRETHFINSPHWIGTLHVLVKPLSTEGTWALMLNEAM